jgi:hypothetical protein
VLAQVFLDKAKTMDNVQKHNICTNIPSPQTFVPYIAQYKINSIDIHVNAAIS